MESSQSKEQWNGLIDHNSVFVTSLGPPASEGPSTSGTPGPSSSGSQQPTPRLTNGHGSGSGAGPGTGSAAAAAAAARGPAGTGGPAGSSESRGASFDEADAPEVDLKQDLGEADVAGGQPAQPQQQQQRPLQDRRASSPFTNGRTELLIPGDPLDAPHRMRTTALVEQPSQEEWSVR
ncbi:Dystonin [Frankliniella fusca]|uniref:Dystonin n=1 Tax=Frankliniella fusca TaxID=407009 RepID=A0AAE1H8Y8_9NEOP|nr:Dystonin [Frankliniella fusca]